LIDSGQVVIPPITRIILLDYTGQKNKPSALRAFCMIVALRRRWLARQNIVTQNP